MTARATKPTKTRAAEFFGRPALPEMTPAEYRALTTEQINQASRRTLDWQRRARPPKQADEQAEAIVAACKSCRTHRANGGPCNGDLAPADEAQTKLPVCHSSHTAAHRAAADNGDIMNLTCRLCVEFVANGGSSGNGCLGQAVTRNAVELAPECLREQNQGEKTW